MEYFTLDFEEQRSEFQRDMSSFLVGAFNCVMQYFCHI